jgi:pSer/pThr/pTyr-binding forkhead associated (FHA) protein
VDGAGEIRPGELVRIQEAERLGMPFVLCRGPDGGQRLLPLGPEVERITIGRGDACELRIEWDERVSRIHAVMERVGDDWVVADDGLSRNGTFVNGARISGRRRLAERDVLRVGRTSLLFRAPAPGGDVRTAAAVSHVLGADDITAAQRRVLRALARPSIQAHELAAPATNEHIAQELHLSVEAVKAHLRQLYQRFGIEELPQGQKRIRLVQLAIESGLVSGQLPRDTDP